MLPRYGRVYSVARVRFARRVGLLACHGGELIGRELRNWKRPAVRHPLLRRLLQRRWLQRRLLPRSLDIALRRTLRVPQPRRAPGRTPDRGPPPALVLPHPAIPRRRFVLRPLAEIDPDLVHPALRKTQAELRGETADPSAVVRLPGVL